MCGDKRRLHHHWLKGTVHCGECGKRLIYTRARNRHGTTYEYFYCVGRQHYDRSCQQGWMSVDAVEDAVIAHYKTIQLSPVRQAKVRAHVLTRIEALERTADQQRDKQQAHIDRIETEQLRLIQAHGAGAVSLKHLVAEQARLKADMRAAEAALRSTQLKFEDIRTTFGRALDPAGDCHGPMSPPRRKSDACSTSCSSSASWSKPATARPASAARPSLARSAPS